ncbi:MAG TPA: hypothetical protein VLK25_09920 [Allosphingosinicella sp.]|nr:hypothetical protein [Allosphingosinicella sp.]
MKSLRAIGLAGSASLLAVALLLGPAMAANSPRIKANRPTLALGGRPVGSFTPAVSDPRLAAVLARRGANVSSEFRFTPAVSGERSRGVSVAVRAGGNSQADTTRSAAATASAPVSAIAPVSYNLGVSLGWRRFAVTGDVAQSDSGVIAGSRESARVGMSYRATRNLTGRVAVGAERNEGAQRLVNGDQAYSLDVGGAFSIARNVDVTAGARYRISRDRLEPIAGDRSRDSQAVYVGTAFRF